MKVIVHDKRELRDHSVLNIPKDCAGIDKHGNIFINCGCNEMLEVNMTGLCIFGKQVLRKRTPERALGVRPFEGSFTVRFGKWEK